MLPFSLATNILQSRNTAAIFSYTFVPQVKDSLNRAIILWFRDRPDNNMTSDRSRSRRTVSRQRPVSCTFCRSRKLRCNRDFPCSNCTSRGLPCQQGTVGSSGGRICCQSSSHTAEILARLKRLENIVLTDPRPQKHGDEEGNQDLVIHPRYRDKESLNSQHEETNIPLSTDGQPQDPDISQLEMVYITGDPKVSSPCTYLKR